MSAADVSRTLPGLLLTTVQEASPSSALSPALGFLRLPDLASLSRTASLFSDGVRHGAPWRALYLGRYPDAVERYTFPTSRRRKRAHACSICLCEFGAVAADEEEEPAAVVLETPCGHQYHQRCIWPWVIEHRSCPLCKSCVTLEECSKVVVAEQQGDAAGDDDPNAGSAGTATAAAAAAAAIMKTTTTTTTMTPEEGAAAAAAAAAAALCSLLSHKPSCRDG